MGKKIDGFMLSVLVAAALYLYFFHAFQNHAAAIVLALLCYILISRMYRKTARLIRNTNWFRRQSVRMKSGGSIMNLACMQPERAKEILASLLEKCYGDARSPELIQLPPSATLQQEVLFEMWKQNQGQEELVICCTGIADAACRALADQLSEPRIALLDSGALSEMIAEHPEGIYFELPPVKRQKLRLQRFSALLLNRKNAPRCLLFSSVMLAMYLLGGNPFYLIGALMLLFAFFASFSTRKRPAKLF